jgi:antitoxin HigA-1
MVKKRKPSHPGLILEELYIKPLHITKTLLAERTGISRNTLYKILRGASRITAEVAIRLAKALNTSVELWLNLQQKYDIWEAEHNKSLHSENIKPIAQIAAQSFR